MKIWIVREDIPYEGYGYVQYVFGSKELAEQALAKLNPHNWEIEETEVLMELPSSL